jgi:hypothetical protein
MSQPGDAWYIRLPDGRVLLARSTAAVRHHLEQGDVPLDCRVRRSPLDSWTALDKVEEFADLTTFALGRSRRNNGHRAGEKNSAAVRAGLALHPVGIRGLLTDLATALDSALVRDKLRPAAGAGLAAGLIVVLGQLLPALVAVPWPPLVAIGQVLALLLVAAWCATVVGGLTYYEQAHLRPARWSEAMTGLLRHVVQLAIANVLVVGGVLLVIWLLRGVPEWLISTEGLDWPAETRQALAAAGTVVRFLGEVFLWPVLGLAVLLGPIVVVEECGALAAVRQWFGLLREHPSRVFLYEVLAVGVAVVAAVPFLVPVEIAALGAPETGPSAAAAGVALWLLRGLALTPALAYLAVANVFIYLTLRYEHPLVR